MQTQRLFNFIGLSSLLALLPLTEAYAQRSGLYLGGSVGAFSINESDFDDNDDLRSLYAGMQFNSWLGVEGSWTDFSKVDNSGSSFKADGKGLAAVLSIPLGETSAVFAKAGRFWWDADSVIGGVIGDSDGDDSFRGIGVKLGLSDHFSLRLEAERYNISNVDLDTRSIGLQYTF